MKASNSIKTNDFKTLKPADKLDIGHVKFAQGLGAALRYSNELRAVQQVGRLPCLKSSNLHEDVLRGALGAGNGITLEQEEAPSRWGRD